MNFNYFKAVTAAALLVIPGASFANTNEIVLDNNGDLRITLVDGGTRDLTFSATNPASIDGFTVTLTVDGSTTFIDTFFGFSGDIYIEANEDDGRDFVDFVDFNLEGTVNILSGRGDDQIQFSGMDVGGGLDVRARQGDDFHRIDTSTFRGPVVLRGFSGRDDFQIFGSSFLDDLRVRGGRDLDLFSISESAFTGDVTRFNGREGFDQINHGRNFPSLTSDNFRNMDIVVNLDTD